MSFTFFIQTFGCKVSQYESQSLREQWQRLGGLETDAPEAADVALVASCAVTMEAVSDARQFVRKLNRIAPRARVIVTGCAATAAPTDFALPEFAVPPLVVPQQHKHLLLALHPLAGNDEFPPLVSSPAEFPPFRIDGFRRARPVLKVQDGCSHRCTYCIVPLTRGPARSRAPLDVVAEARRLLAAGYREIMISGINLRQYRHEGLHFWDLLRLLDAELAPEWAGRVRFRLSSLEPAQLDEEGLDTLASSRLLCPHIHLSLQSGSPTVLRRMGRSHYRPEGTLQAVERIRQFWPMFALGADILMGFPGETDAELAETLQLVQALPLTYAHVFPWSPRPGTAAVSMPHILPKKVRQDHAAQVRAIVTAKHDAFLALQLSLSSFQVALDGDDGHSGINEFYAPCILPGQGHDLHLARPLRIEHGKIVCE